MGLLPKSVKKLFGAAKKLFGPANEPMPGHFRGEESAAISVQAQSGRRKKLLEARVRAGLSAKVYQNKKPINVLSTGIAGALDSPYLADFLDGFPYARFASSNVWQIVYDRTQNRLHIQFMGGSGKKRSGPGKWFSYGSVSLTEARTIYNSASKGTWTWDHLRVRGTRHGHKKPMKKNDPPPSYLPLGRKRTNILQSP